MTGPLKAPDHDDCAVSCSRNRCGELLIECASNCAECPQNRTDFSKKLTGIDTACRRPVGARIAVKVGFESQDGCCRRRKTGDTCGYCPQTASAPAWELQEQGVVRPPAAGLPRKTRASQKVLRALRPVVGHDLGCPRQHVGRVVHFRRIPFQTPVSPGLPSDRCGQRSGPDAACFVRTSAFGFVEAAHRCHAPRSTGQAHRGRGRDMNIGSLPHAIG